MREPAIADININGGKKSRKFRKSRKMKNGSGQQWLDVALADGGSEGNNSFIDNDENIRKSYGGKKFRKSRKSKKGGRFNPHKSSNNKFVDNSNMGKIWGRWM